MTSPPPEHVGGWVADLVSNLTDSGYSADQIAEAVEADEATIDGLLGPTVDRLIQGLHKQP